MGAGSEMHEDYQKIRPFTLAFNWFVVGLLNIFLKTDIFFKARKVGPGLDSRTQTITSVDGGRFKVRILTPQEEKGPLPVLLYYHGGAFALGAASLHHLSCQRLARERGCLTLVVDYRLGPGKPWPAGFEDCYSAYEWVLGNAAMLNADSTRIVVMGDSAGGTLAAGVAQKALDLSTPLAGQVLVYPVLDSDCKTVSATEFVDTPIWNAESNRRMWKMYLKNVAPGDLPQYAVPGHREDLSGLVPAYIETAEFDPLRDEAAEYAGRLIEAGVEVELNQTRGTIHGYEMAENSLVEDAMQRRSAALARIFHE